MSRRSRPTLKLSLLSYAIAFAASGGATQSALAVDLCIGQSAVTVSTANAGDGCSLDTANAKLTVSETGAIDQGVYGAVSGVSVSNAGTISAQSEESDFASGTSAYASAGAAALYLSGDLGGSLNNTGTISAGANANATAYGSSSSSSYYPGSAYAYADAKGVDVDGSALVSISNSGLISAHASANAYGDDGEAADARATAFHIGGNLAATLNNTGSIEGYASAEAARAYGFEAGEISGKLSNAGRVAAEAYGYSAQAVALDVGTLTGTISNSGDIDAHASGYAARAVGLGAGELSGAVSNKGEIEVFASGYQALAIGLDVGNLTGSINNNGDIEASASGYAAQAVGLQADAVAGVFSNGGSIDAEAYVSSGYFAQAVGVRAYDVTGTISNSGNIEAEAYASGSSGYFLAQASGLELGNVSGSVVNSGEIAAFANGSEAISYALSVDGDFSGEVKNSGDLLAVAYANNNADAVAVQLGFGMSSSSPSLLVAPATTLVGAFTNNGTITAASSAYSASAMTLHVGGDFGGVITNTNTMNAFAEGFEAEAVGVVIDGTLSGALINAGKGDIVAAANGYEAGAYGVGIGGDLTGSLTNAGNIRALASGYEASAYALSVDGAISGSMSNSGTIYAEARAEFESASAYGVYASGGLSGEGKLVNTGTISAIAVASSTSGDDASAYGIHFGSSNGGAITNSGRIETSAISEGWAGAYGVGSWNGTSLDGTAILNTGSGHIVAEASGNSASAYGIYNNGSLNNGASITSNGRITATAQGQSGSYASAWGIYTSGYVNESSISNGGVITATADMASSDWAGAWGIYASNIYNSTISNTGTIVATASSGSSSASAYGIDVSYVSGESAISNSGQITASATADSGSAYAWGINTDSLNDAAAIVNSGTISAAASADTWASAWGIDAGSMNDSSSITNSGTIRATATSANSSASANGIRFDSMADGTSVTNSGRITVAATVSATDNNWAGAYGVGSWNTINPGGSIENTGVIAAYAEGSRGSAYGIFSRGDFNGASVNNSGTILAATRGRDGSYASAYGIYMEGNRTDVAISNSGRIVADAAADGSAWVGAYGIRAGFWSYGASSVDNSGTITATASSLSGSGSAYGMLLGVLGDATAVTNSGSITVATVAGSNFASAYGIITNDLNGAASVSNSGAINARADMTGSGSSDDAYAYGIRTNSVTSGTSVSNSGTIVAEANAANGWAEAYGIQVTGSLAAGATISNTGSIRAVATGTSSEAFGIKVNAANSIGATVDNSGLIDGGVSLNGGMSMTMTCIPMGTGPCMPMPIMGSGTISLTNSGAIVTNAGTQSRVDGGYTQGADGVLGFRVVSSSDYASLYVRDTADFTAGNRVHMLVDVASQLQDGDSLNDVISAGALTLPAGSEFNLTDNSLFWEFQQTIDGNTLDLTVNYLGVAPVLAGGGQAFTPSQLAFAEQLVTGGYGTQFSEVFEALNGAADAAAAADILEGIGPVLAGAAGNSIRAATGGASKAVSARMGETRGASSGDAFSSNNVWIKPYLGKAEQDSVGGVDGYDVDTTGVVIGIDGNVSDSWRLGVAVATAQSDVEGDKADLEADTTQFTLYGSYAMSESASLDLDLNHAVNSFDSTRRVAVIGSNALSSYDGSQLAFGAKVSNRVAMGEKSAFIPSLMARYQRVDLDGYSETGAGVYNLSVGDSEEDSLLWAAEGAFEIGLGAGSLLANAGIGYDSLDAASVTATLNGGSGPTFISNGIKPESTVVTGGVGYRYVTAKNLEINVAYDAESRGDFLAQTASVKFKLPF